MRFLPKLIKPATSILKNVAAPLGLSAAMSRIDNAIQRKVHGYGSKSSTTVKFSNEEINDMINIVKALEDSDILMKGSTKTLKNDVQKGAALPLIPMLLGTLGVSLLSRRGNRIGNDKCNCGKRMYRAGEGLFRAGQGIKKKLLMPGNFSLKNSAHPLGNFEIMKYFEKQSV